jgi:hypothetical protein
MPHSIDTNVKSLWQSVCWNRLGFIMCRTESTKNISTWYKSYSLVDLYQFLLIKCVLLAKFLNQQQKVLYHV